MNIELLQKVRDVILARPDTYDQYEWCGTALCIAGHAVAMAMPDEFREEMEAYGDATHLVCRYKCEVLDVGAHQGGRLFYSDVWPHQFRWEEDATPNERATLGAARIDHFIATGGAE